MFFFPFGVRMETFRSPFKFFYKFWSFKKIYLISVHIFFSGVRLTIIGVFILINQRQPSGHIDYDCSCSILHHSLYFWPGGVVKTRFLANETSIATSMAYILTSYVLWFKESLTFVTVICPATYTMMNHPHFFCILLIRRSTVSFFQKTAALWNKFPARCSPNH